MNDRILFPWVVLTIAVMLSIQLTGCTDSPVDALDSETLTMDLRDEARTDPLGNINRLPANMERIVQTFRSDLEMNGYAVARGYWTLWGVEDCKYPLRTVGFCYGNNPTAPYVMAVVPRWKDEFVDQSLHHALMAAQRNMAPNYRLAPREALVIAAQMPPPARYFGIATNVFTRETTLNEADPIYQRITDIQLRDIAFGFSPNPARMMMIASIGNATNNVVIEQQSGESFGAQRYFVITPDASVADAVIEALGRAGVPSEHVFVEPVSPDLVRLGLGSASDDMITYIRYAMPENDVLGEEWRKRLPLAVLRVRDMGPGGAIDPFAIPAYEERSWNMDEPAELSEDIESLVAAVKEHWQQPDADVLVSFSAHLFLDLVGQHCLGSLGPQRGPMNCLGDSQEADYQISRTVHIDDGQVVALVGTLATETNNATYVSLGVNWFPALVGVQNISDLRLKGTAAPFAASLQHDDRLFYVHYVARDCAGIEPCLEIPRKLVPIGGAIKIIQRNYIVPGTRRGVEPTKLLPPRAIVFDGAARPSAF